MILSILIICLLVHVTYDWVFKSKSTFNAILKFVLILLVGGVIHSAIYITPKEVKDLTTQVNTLTRQVETLEQNQKEAKP